MSDTDDGSRQPRHTLTHSHAHTHMLSRPVLLPPNYYSRMSRRPSLTQGWLLLVCSLVSFSVWLDPLLAPSSASRAARYNKKKIRLSSTSPLQSFRAALSSTLAIMPGLSPATSTHDLASSASVHTTLLTPSSSASSQSAAALASLRSRRYVLGLLYLAVVVFLWVASSALIQWIFEQRQSSGAFFLTYFSTSLFTLYLPSYYAMQACIRSQLCPRLFPAPVEPASSSSSGSASTSSLSSPASVVVPFTVRQHVHLSLLLSPIWFLMEYLYNESLSLTSLSQNTILSTTSGVFVLLFNWLFFREALTLLNLLGVAFTFAGAYLVYHDGRVADEEGAKDSVLGDVLAVSAAVFYGLYTVVVKWKVREEGQVNWQLVLGFLGLINFTLYWPLFLLLQAADIEAIPSPSGTILLSLLLNGLLGTVLADYLWARSILLTSPLVATMGLTLNIPCSLLVEWLWKGRQYGWVYAVGGLSVLCGFVMVNVKERQKEKEKGLARGEAEEADTEEGQEEAALDDEDGLRDLGGEGLDAELVSGVKRASVVELDDKGTPSVSASEGEGPNGWGEGSRRQRSEESDGNQISRHDLEVEYSSFSHPIPDSESSPVLSRSASRSALSSMKEH